MIVESSPRGRGSSLVVAISTEYQTERRSAVFKLTAHSGLRARCLQRLGRKHDFETTASDLNVRIGMSMNASSPFRGAFETYI